jgi:hypothetical protein
MWSRLCLKKFVARVVSSVKQDSREVLEVRQIVQ